MTWSPTTLASSGVGLNRPAGTTTLPGSTDLEPLKEGLKQWEIMLEALLNITKA